ncbi:MAG TPA: hypothetical protein PKC28_06150 [Bdellovibrionales bacterium]|nr:hypothetical protein [Bdellovibrionales bacterium]
MIFLTWLCGWVWASTAPVYDLRIELSRNGGPVAVSKVRLVEGATALIAQEVDGKQTYFEVMATGQGGDAVMAEFEVGIIDPKGHKTIRTRPRISALIGEPASIQVGREGLPPEFSLSVIVSRDP